MDYSDYDDLLDLLYKYSNSSSDDCFKFKSKHLIDYELDELKIINPSEFHLLMLLKGLKKSFEYKNIEVFTKDKTRNHKAFVKIGYYKDKGGENTKTNKYVNNILVSIVLTELLLMEELKFILMPVMFFDIPPSKHPTGGKGDKNCHVQIFENFNETTTLKLYLEDKNNINNENKMWWQSLLFQILYALYRIQRSYKGFRHNRLDLESVYITKNIPKNNEGDNKYRVFRVGSYVFNVPNIGYDIKLTNFYHSTFDKNENEYYDIHYFFHSLINHFDGKPPKVISALLDEIVPREYRYTGEGTEFKGLDEIEYYKSISRVISPSIILSKFNFFVDIIKTDMDSATSPMLNSEGKQYLDSPTSSIYGNATDSSVARFERKNELNKLNNFSEISEFSNSPFLSTLRTGLTESEDSLVGGKKKNKEKSRKNSQEKNQEKSQEKNQNISSEDGFKKISSFNGSRTTGMEGEGKLIGTITGTRHEKKETQTMKGRKSVRAFDDFGYTEASASDSNYGDEYGDDEGIDYKSSYGNNLKDKWNKLRSSKSQMSVSVSEQSVGSQRTEEGIHKNTNTNSIASFFGENSTQPQVPPQFQQSHQPQSALPYGLGMGNQSQFQESMPPQPQGYPMESIPVSMPQMPMDPSMGMSMGQMGIPLDPSMGMSMGPSMGLPMNMPPMGMMGGSKKHSNNNKKSNRKNKADFFF